MVVDAEALLDSLQDKNESDGPTFKIEKDPRITKIGRILRKTSLDELVAKMVQYDLENADYGGVEF